MPRADWKWLRIRNKTHQKLMDFIASLGTAIDQGKIVTKYRHLVSVTADDAVAFLLDREFRKKERAKQSKKRRRELSASVELEAAIREGENIDVSKQQQTPKERRGSTAPTQEQRP